MLSDSNTLERPFIWKLIPTPRDVELMGDLLVWMPSEKRLPPLDPQPSDVGLLHQFIRFCGKNTPPEEILKFARKWGIFGFCQHFRPMPHPLLDPDDGDPMSCQYLQLPTGEYYEALEFWRDYSRRARAMLRIASRLNQNKQGYFDDWKVLDPARKRPLSKSSVMLMMERSAISDEIEDWLYRGNVSLKFDWPGERPSIYFRCNLLGLIACHMMFAISRSQGFAICTSCGFPYPPKRRPSPKRANYCLSCRETSPSRESQARARSKKRESK